MIRREKVEMVFMYCPLRSSVALDVPAASDTLILEDVEDSRTTVERVPRRFLSHKHTLSPPFSAPRSRTKLEKKEKRKKRKSRLPKHPLLMQ